MKMTTGLIAAVLFSLATLAVVGFQVALALGAPWGSYAMGGQRAGQYPPAMRAAAVVQAALLALLAAVVLDAGGVLALGWTATFPWLPWIPVVASLASAIANAATRSVVERRLWLPVAMVMLLSSLVVATR
jgi:hypothetical protein